MLKGMHATSRCPLTVYRRLPTQLCSCPSQTMSSVHPHMLTPKRLSDGSTRIRPACVSSNMASRTCSEFWWTNGHCARPSSTACREVGYWPLNTWNAVLAHTLSATPFRVLQLLMMYGRVTSKSGNCTA